jgi:ABC-2 type transport system ATP-binding protein
MESDNAIGVQNLVKKYGNFTAVDGISFEVKKGELFGLLGPNGAGKTTTIKMLTTILEKTSGDAKVAGHDIVKEPNEVRKSIGIVFQDPSLDDKLTGRENLEMHAILYKMGKAERNAAIDRILKLIELEDKQDILIENYSGGMKRRLEIGRGLIHDPEVLFLDEPTLGLDVQTRRKIWEYIKRLNAEKKVTMVLTTHYIEEADELCNRVAFIDHGKIIALDTPTALKNSVGGDVISLDIDGDGAALRKVLEKTEGVKTVTLREGAIDISLKNGEEHIPRIIELADKSGIKVKSVHFHKPSLEDVFIQYTGKTIREEEGVSAGKSRMRTRVRGAMR